MANDTMRFGLVDRIYLCFHGTDAPNDGEWNAYVEDMAKSADHFDVMLVFSLGGGPSGPQRRSVAALWHMRGRMPKIALVTPSAVARAAGTALNWVLRQPIKSFTPSELDTSLAHLDASESQRAAIKRALEDYAGQLGVGLGR